MSDMPRRITGIHVSDFRLKVAWWTHLAKRKKNYDLISTIKKFETE